MNIAGPSRIRLTAAERCRRQGESSLTISEAEDDPQVEEGKEDEESGELTASFLSGPTDITLLQSFKTHIAANIWTCEEGEPLKCISHASKLSEWV